MSSKTEAEDAGFISRGTAKQGYAAPQELSSPPAPTPGTGGTVSDIDGRADEKKFVLRCSMSKSSSMKP